MNYQQAMDEINSRLRFGSKPGLERIQALLEQLGNPQEKLKFVHVAGTNGKGTTCTYISSVLRAAGYKTGLYTSPYVVDFRERFQINGEMISEQQLVQAVESVKPYVERMEEELTEFEYITALAMYWFAQMNCDVVVLEVGLGGRFDATNVIPCPEAAVITAISLDHTEILGDTLEKIAFEKAGIIKPHGDVVLYPKQGPGVEATIRNLCTERGAHCALADLSIQPQSETLTGSTALFNGLRLELPFSGAHQLLNAATALSCLYLLRAKGYSISDGQLQEGFRSAGMAARMELISENPLVILDGGHNPGCAQALRDLIEKQLSGKKISAVMGMMADKDSRNYLRAVAPLFSEIITAAPQNPRAMSSEALAEAAREFCPRVLAAASMEAAALEAFRGTWDALIVCGSLFLAGEIRPLLQAAAAGT